MIVIRIAERAKTNDLVFLDYNTNIEFRDVSSPLSHAGLVKLYVEGNYPDGTEIYTPFTPEESKERKKALKEEKKNNKKNKQQKLNL